MREYVVLPGARSARRLPLWDRLRLRDALGLALLALAVGAVQAVVAGRGV